MSREGAGGRERPRPHLLSHWRAALSTSSPLPRTPLRGSLEAELTAAVGDYQAVDAAVKANDLFVFRAFLTRGKNASEVRRMLENNFANFSDASWARVLEWNASSAGAGGAGGR